MNEETLFAAALEIEDIEARKTFLDENAAGTSNFERHWSTKPKKGWLAINSFQAAVIFSRPRLRRCGGS